MPVFGAGSQVGTGAMFGVWQDVVELGFVVMDYAVRTRRSTLWTPASDATSIGR